MFPDLGKYAIPVLSAYGASLALIAAIIVISLRQSAKTREALRRVEEDHGSKDSPYV